jgi:cytochrome c
MRDGRKIAGAVACVLIGGVIVTLVGLCAWNRGVIREATELTGGDPRLGRLSIRQHGCPACHVIPGVPGAYGLVGPSLDGIARRMYIAGVLPNTPENMILWIQIPQALNTRTVIQTWGLRHPRRGISRGISTP